MSDIRPSCCREARNFDGESMGIHHSDGDEASHLSEVKKKRLKHGWHLIYDNWYWSQRIDFCPFCGGKLE